MGDQLREEVGALSENVRALVSKWDDQFEARIRNEGRIASLEIWVRVLIAIDVAIGLAVLGLIMERIGKVVGGN